MAVKLTISNFSALPRTAPTKGCPAPVAALCAPRTGLLPRRVAGSHLAPLPHRRGSGGRGKETTRIYASTSTIDKLQGALSPDTVVSVNRKMGEGSFGQVFEGDMVIKGQQKKVVMKRLKPRVERALEMGEIEIMLNQAVTKRAKGACAEYIGHMQVSSAEANTRVGFSEGLWLVWEYQGFKTLDSYLKQRDFIKRLSYDMEVTEEAVIPTIMKQTFECLQRLHAAKIVHRDVKPMNLLFCETDRRFRLIDLGACADLSTGVNYHPEESIFDPVYCAPEQYILPTDTADIARLAGPMKSLASTAAWSKHRPDRFDMYSAGIMLMQLSVPKLRMQSTLKAFANSVQNFKHDPQLWALRQGLTSRETAFLDDNGHEGWELAKALLRERSIDKNKMSVSDKVLMRPSARDALSYKFLKQANIALQVAGSYDSEDESLDRLGGGQTTVDSVDEVSGTWLQRMFGSMSGSRADSSTEEDDERLAVSNNRR